MKDARSNVPQQFGVTIKNKTIKAKNIALFCGAVDTTSIVEDEEGKQILTKGDPRGLNQLGLGVFDAVMCDGTLPNNEGKIFLKEESREAVIVKPLVSSFSVNHMREHLKSNYYKIKRMIIKVQNQDQFDNQISFATICPFQNYGISSIAPTNYATPQNFQNNKIIIDDLAYVLGDDTFMGWTINAGETINITFELE